ncbi:MAG: GldG family protein [Eubacteriales bacterium]|nr:GldG family protein [Eubacteriales bacterium]
MDKPKFKIPESGHALKSGSRSIVATVILLAVLIIVNIVVSLLPPAMTKIDISSARLYSISENTKDVISGLQDDVTIYWIVQADQEDDVLDNLLSEYSNLSSHITVEKIDPDLHPTFAEAYTDEYVENNSLVVVNGDKSKYISYYDIYLYETDPTYEVSYVTAFDGEGAVTSAIDYVTNADFPIVYALQGHGEEDIPEVFAKQIANDNIVARQLSLLTSEAIPDDAAALMIFSPQSDISENEEEIIAEYVKNGGKLLVMAGRVENDLDNLYGLLGYYGVSTSKGVVIETDADHFSPRQPYVLLPDMISNDLTSSLVEQKYSVVLPLTLGMTVESNGNGLVTPILKTSDKAFSKTNWINMTTYDKEDGDTDGPFYVGIKVEDRNKGVIIWYSSSTLLTSQVNSLSSGANAELAINSLAYLTGESEAMAIQSKSLNYNYLTISSSQSTVLMITMIAVIPLIYLFIGICVFFWTRRRRGEAGA